MNQRITKLVRQALNECVSTPVESVIASRIDDHGIVEIPNTFAEKFSELIVRECMDICKHDSDDDDDQFYLGRVYQAKEITQLIKKHFGVEE